MMNQMIAGVRIEDLQAVMVADTGTMMTQTIVAVQIGDHQMAVVADQLLEEIQVADLLIAGMEVAVHGVPVPGHHLHNLLMVGEGVVKIGAKAHQQEAIAHHQAMEEELVARKVLLLHGAKEHHVDQQRENRASALFSYLSNCKFFLWQSIQKKLEKKLKR